jgi:hypothetical protein
MNNNHSLAWPKSHVLRRGTANTHFKVFGFICTLGKHANNMVEFTRFWLQPFSSNIFQ